MALQARAERVLFEIWRELKNKDWSRQTGQRATVIQLMNGKWRLKVERLARHRYSVDENDWYQSTTSQVSMEIDPDTIDLLFDGLMLARDFMKAGKPLADSIPKEE